jgi:UDP-glucose 4-epimerase
LNLLVTGAGLVGCYVAQLMSERGHSVVLYDLAPNRAYAASVAPKATLVQGDVGDLPGLLDVLRDHAIDVVAHTAFLIGERINAHPHAGMRTNVDGAMALAEAVRLSGVKRLLFASTFGIYRWDLGPAEPISEDFPVGGDRFYAASKIACERILTAFAKWYGFEFAILRFAQIYGPGHYAGGDAAGPAMHEALATAMAGRPVGIDPGVLSTNDYVYAKDVASGVGQACERPLLHEIYNFGSGRISHSNDVAEAIRAAVPDAQVEVLPKPVRGPFWTHEQRLDLTRSHADLGYEPAFDLTRGLADFAGYLRQQEQQA